MILRFARNCSAGITNKYDISELITEARDQSYYHYVDIPPAYNANQLKTIMEYRV